MAEIVLYGLFHFLVAFALMLCLYFVSKEILDFINGSR